MKKKKIMKLMRKLRAFFTHLDGRAVSLSNGSHSSTLIKFLQCLNQSLRRCLFPKMQLKKKQQSWLLGKFLQTQALITQLNLAYQ